MRTRACTLLVVALAGCPSRGPGPQSGARPDGWAVPLEAAGLQNFHRVTSDLYRGAQPGRQGFETLEGVGVRTVVNLRLDHSDEEDLEGLQMGYVEIPIGPQTFSDRDVARFIGVVVDPQRVPVFVHCRFGADRTGLMIAAYRVVMQGWTREEAVEEMVEGGFGYHEVFEGPVDYVRTFDVQAVRDLAGISE